MMFRKRPSKSESNRQKLVLENRSSAPLEVMVEVIPDRYVLRPRDQMEIDAEMGGAPFSMHFYDGGVQIYPGNDCGPPVTINGLAVKPDWETPGPNANKPPRK
jgi:hypothetical protein